MNNVGECNGWKWLGIAAALAAAYVVLTMLPDLKRYVKIETM